MNSECPLCKAEKITKWLCEDEVCWVAYCKSHPDKVIIVLKRHTPQPTPEEAEHIQQVAEKFFPNKKWRYPKSLPQHFHLHEI